MTPQESLDSALSRGNYQAAERAMRRGATFLDRSTALLFDDWLLSLHWGPRHLAWMRDHADLPSVAALLPTLLGSAWISSVPDVAAVLLSWGVDPNELTFGGATPFLHAIRSPDDGVFSWAMEHTHRGLGCAADGHPHDPFEVVFSPNYRLGNFHAFGGLSSPSPGRFKQLLDTNFELTKSPFHALVKHGRYLSPDRFVDYWQGLIAAGFSPHEQISSSGRVPKTFRQAVHVSHREALASWESSQYRHRKLQSHLHPVTHRRPRS